MINGRPPLKQYNTNIKNASGADINPATEETLSQLIQSVDNALSATAYDLNAAAYSGTTNITNDYELPMPCYTGQISGIWSSANGNMLITELQ